MDITAQVLKPLWSDKPNEQEGQNVHNAQSEDIHGGDEEGCDLILQDQRLNKIGYYTGDQRKAGNKYAEADHLTGLFGTFKQGRCTHSRGEDNIIQGNNGKGCHQYLKEKTHYLASPFLTA